MWEHAVVLQKFPGIEGFCLVNVQGPKSISGAVTALECISVFWHLEADVGGNLYIATMQSRRLLKMATDPLSQIVSMEMRLLFFRLVTMCELCTFGGMGTLRSAAWMDCMWDPSGCWNLIVLDFGRFLTWGTKYRRKWPLHPALATLL